MAALSSGGSAEGASLFNGDMEPEPPPTGACYAGGSGSAGGDPAIPEETTCPSGVNYLEQTLSAIPPHMSYLELSGSLGV
uniref:Uncharacterized protein n=1 Tax=Sphaerodactylus townsendi TaxID=933632 RepID=A0ACB8FN82_9SAUR